jgi:two-component system response regulator HydG
MTWMAAILEALTLSCGSLEATCSGGCSVQAYLTMTRGTRAGTSFSLDEAGDNAVGRDPNGAVALDDLLCSRLHAVIGHHDGVWSIRDAESRNGTYVNGQKIDEATIAEGHIVRVGSTELAFHLTDEPLPASADEALGMTQSVVMDRPVDTLPPDRRETTRFVPESLHDWARVEELLLLYQLSIKLLGCEEPDEIIRVALDLLYDRTDAAVVGFLWVGDDGQLRRKLVLPGDSDQRVALSQLLTDLVCRQRHAVWIADQAAGQTAKLEHYADAVCVPLVNKRGQPGGIVIGAIHVYRQQGHFRQSDFELTISVANIVSVALVRARSHLSLQSNYRRLVESSPGYDELIGESLPMQQLKSKLARVARASGCVLIRGESGTGKELVARAIHAASTRADRPMLSVNCAAIPADLMESQLFGHRAGAFTGADRDHVGYFEQADLATLVLDEVGEMTLDGQAKLLRILEGHPFLPVGGTDEIDVDVRVIAATNQNLQDYVRERRFREDLYYRLNVFELLVPPLRERDGDVDLLIDFFFDHFRRLHGRPALRMSIAARAALRSYRWPGNVRQLRNVLDSAVVLADAAEIEVGDLGLREVAGGALESLRIDHWERKLILEALARSGGHVPKAAELLGIGRATLYRKLDQYGIERASKPE